MNNKLTNERIASLVYGSDGWGNFAHCDYADIACALRELQEYRNAQQVVPDEIEPDDSNTFDYVDGWNACRAAMLEQNQKTASTNFRENTNLSTEHFRETGETSTKCRCSSCLAASILSGERSINDQ